jgi:pimeloyl-ACP methyl ester carboxylesterase
VCSSDGAAYTVYGLPPFVALLTKPDGSFLGCALGGQPKRAGEPSGYAFSFPDTVLRGLVYRADPAVVRAVLATVERNPCGIGTSLVQTLAVDRLRLGTITVPVLLLFGDHDEFFPPPDGERQKALYSGSPDVTYELLPNTGHAMEIDGTAPTARAAVSAWLHARGF